jgi:hypothetical protein
VINSDGIPTKWHESMPYERQGSGWYPRVKSHCYRMGPPLIAAFSCLKKVAEFYGLW